MTGPVRAKGMTARRILVLASAAYPLGGLATWMGGLLPGLEEAGWEATLGLVEGTHGSAAAFLARHPWHRSVAIPNPTGTVLGRRRALAGAIERVDPALVLVVNLESVYPAVQDLRARERWGGRLVMTLHGFTPGLIEDVRRFRTVLDGVVFSNALGVAALREWGYLAPERVLRAGYGVSLPDALPEEEEAAGPLEIVWAGRFEESQKRVADLVRIVSELEASGEPFRLHLAGSGPEEASLRERLAPALAAGRVLLHGELPRERVLGEVMRPGRVLLVTSSWETGPIVALEAVSRGMAVVTTDYVGCRAEALLRHGETALVFPVGDAEEGSRALRELADPGRRRALAGAAWREVSRRCSPRAALADWIAALESVLALPRLPRPLPPEPPGPAGRLDRWFGVRGAEMVRRLTGARVRHESAGSEWPHTAGSDESMDELLTRLRRLEQGISWPGHLSPGGGSSG